MNCIEDMSPGERACLLAAELAQAMRLPPGNLWEPAAARNIEAHARTVPWEEVRATWRARLGL